MLAIDIKVGKVVGLKGSREREREIAIEIKN